MRGDPIASVSKVHVDSGRTLNDRIITICGQRIAKAEQIANQPKCRECSIRARRLA